MNTDQQANKNHIKAIRKISIWLSPKIIETYQQSLQKIHLASIYNSQQFIEMRVTEFFKRLSKLYYLKLRQSFYSIQESLLIGDVASTQKSIESTKVKDRVYEAKVKSLRVLSRQWKQKKSQNIYKNKYFTPKAQQTPKMQKQKVAEQVYIILRTLLRNKYLQTFNVIQRTQVTRSIKSKTIYLFNYLVQKRRYWLIYGMDKMKLAMLVNRQQKHNQQITQLDTKLAPVQDPQLQSLKEKQQRLQSTLQATYKQKQSVTKQVDDEITNIQQQLQQKKSYVQTIIQQKTILTQKIQQLQKTQQLFTFTRQQIFYLIYEKLLVNVKLWMQAQVIDGNAQITKGDVLEWLVVPQVRFSLDRINYLNNQQQQQMNSIVITLTQLIKNYQKIITTKQPSMNKRFNYSDIIQKFFFSPISTQSYQQLLAQTKFTHKILQQVVKQNANLMTEMLEEIDRKHHKVAQESLEILDG